MRGARGPDGFEPDDDEDQEEVEPDPDYENDRRADLAEERDR